MASVTLTVDVKRQGLDTLQKDINALSNKKISVDITTNAQNFLAVERSVKALRSKTIKVSVQADSKELTTLKSRLNTLKNKSVKVTVNVVAGKLTDLRTRLGNLRDKTVRIGVRVDASALTSLERRIKALQSSTITVKVNGAASGTASGGGGGAGMATANPAAVLTESAAQVSGLTSGLRVVQETATTTANGVVAATQKMSDGFSTVTVSVNQSGEAVQKASINYGKMAAAAEKEAARIKAAWAEEDAAYAKRIQNGFGTLNGAGGNINVGQQAVWLQQQEIAKIRAAADVVQKASINYGKMAAAAEKEAARVKAAWAEADAAYAKRIQNGFGTLNGAGGNINVGQQAVWLQQQEIAKIRAAAGVGAQGSIQPRSTFRAQTTEQTAAIRASTAAWDQNTMALYGNAQAFGKTAKAQGQVASGTKQLTGLASIMGDSLGNIAVKMTAWQIAGNLISKPIVAINDAVDTMQAMDDEMVNIRKVSSMTAEQLDAVEASAYKVASAYGVTAEAYLQSVTSFSRAGYNELSQSLAELSVKTQLVGDMSADVADQFLLAVDAAYQYQGNVEKLGAVIDGTDKIGNNFATSMEKIAQGLGKVSTIAAQGHVGIDELSAALGTVTAVTQRSGNEAATALRALFLNIMGDTKTEIEDGATWTAGEIEGLRDILRIYASDAIEAAEATGSIIDPMEAIGGLAQSMKDGLLTEQELMEMVSDIGGKLRTAQLLALVQNWDMYQEMLTYFNDSAGYADAEVEKAQEAWTRKANVLKNTFTELVANVTGGSEQFEAVIEGATAALDVLNSGLGVTAIQLTTVFGIVKLVSGSFLGLNLAGLVTEVAALAGIFMKAAEASGVAAASVKLLDAAFAELAANPAVLLGVLAAATFGAFKLIDAVTVSLEEQRAKVSELNTEYQNLYGAGSEYAELSSRADSLTAAERRRLAVLEAEKEALEGQLQAARDLEFAKFNQDDSEGTTQGHGRGWWDATGGESKSRSNLDALNNGYETLIENYKQGTVGNAEFREELAKLSTEQKEYYDALLKYRDLGYDLSDEQDDFIRQYEKLGDVLATCKEGYYDARAALDAFWDANMDGTGGIDSLKDKYEQFLGLFNSGMTNSSRYKDLVDELFPADLFDSLGRDYEQAGELLANQFWQGVFSQSGDSDISGTFVGALYGMADADGKIVDENGNVVASFAEVDGAVNLSIENFDALANSLGISAEALQTLLGTAQDASTIDGTAESVAALCDQLGVLTLAASESADGLMHIPLEAFVNACINAGYGEQQIRALIGAMSDVNGVSFDNAEGEVANLQGDLDAAIEKGQGLEDKLNDVDSTTATPKIDADTSSADTKINAIVSRLDSLSTKTWTFHTSVAGDSEASGTTNAPGGVTLVNELGPEIIREGGRARIAGGGLPTFTEIQPGAQVFNATQTKQILERSGGVFNAMAGEAPGSSAKYSFNSTWLNAYTNGSKGGSSGGGSGGSSGGSKPSSGGTGGKTSSSGSSRGSSSRAAASVTGANADQLKEELDLLRAQYSYLEASGGTVEQLVEKSGQIQDKLHQINDALRRSGGEEKEITDNSTSWWKELDTIHATIKKAFEDERSLMESNLKLLQAQSGSAEDQIEIIKKIQENLHKEAEYLRSIGAEQEEINKLSQEWWSQQDDILKIQKALWDELDDAVSEYLDEAKKARDDEIDAIDRVIDGLKKQREVKKDALSLEEKQLAAEKARAAWENAQEERNTRYYNAKTGQWEWGASQESVDSAEKAYKDALEDLNSYEEELAYNAVLDEMNARKDALNAAYNTLEANWKTILKSVETPTRSISEILQDIAKNGTPQMKAQIENVGHYLGDLANYIKGAVGPSSVLQSLTNAEAAAAKLGGTVDYGTIQRDYTNDKTDYAALILKSTSLGEAEYWAEQRELKAKAQGIKLGEGGYQTTNDILKQWAISYAPGNPALQTTTTASASTQNSGDVLIHMSKEQYVQQAVKNGIARTTAEREWELKNAHNAGLFSYNMNTVSSSTGVKKAGANAQSGSNAHKFDSGGILNGMGGIKATMADEMVIPPDVTAKMLNATDNDTFRRRMNELRYVYGSKSDSVKIPTGTVSSRTSNDHYGDCYTFGNITMSEQQARGTTVYELARLSKGLGAYNWTR